MTGLGTCHICVGNLHGDSHWVQDRVGLWCESCYRESKGLTPESTPGGELLATLLLNGRTLGDVEALLIESAIKIEKGNLSRAAKRLGIGRATIYRKMGPSSEVRGESDH